MFSKLKQIKELRDQAKNLQNELAQETVSGDWHNKINLVMDGNQKILSLEIEPELLNLDRKEELERGLRECFNDTVKKAQMAAARKMQSMGGLGSLPGFGS